MKSWPLLRHILILPLLGVFCAYAKPIKLRNQTIDPARANVLQSTVAAAEDTRGLWLLQLKGPITQEWREQLKGLEVELQKHVPEDAFIVRLKKVPAGQLRRLDFVEWLGRYRPEHKIHAAAARAGNEPAVSVLLGRGATPNEIINLRRFFRRVHQESSSRFGTVLRGQLAPNQLRALSESDAVLWIEPAPNIKLFDEVSSDIVAGLGGVHTTTMQDLGYDGSGVSIAVADSGLHTGNAPGMHPDLAGRVTAFFHYGNLDDAADEHSHGTHVAGIVAGNGAIGESDENGALYGLGVAPGANIIAQRIFDGLGNYEAPSTFETLTRDAVRAGADIGSNSWGDDTQGRYDISAAEFDALVRDADALTLGDQQYILEFSAGNAGPGAQTIGSPAVAKNVIATGASQNERLDFFLWAEGQDAMADFSSRGPCEDGRIKPDIVAPGTWIASLRSALADDNNAWADISPNYLYQGGTSQAGPHASGAAALFVQSYRETHGTKPSPALVKAALINSAVDMDDSAGTDPIPNNDEGWGRLDLTQLIESVRGYDFVDQTVTLASGQIHERRAIVAEAIEPLKITLTYTDVPGFPGSLPALVNDLDLEVVAPDGRVYRGNQFTDGESLPGATGRDTVNNVEAVHIFEPIPGEYIIRVRAQNVAEDARVDTAVADQDFALVSSALLLPPGISAVFLDRPAYTAPAAIRISVVDLDAAGSPTLSATVRSTLETAGENVVLRASSSSGIFTNTVLTATGAPVADGRLQVAHGNTITASYEDASAGVTRNASAIADLNPPIITAVAVTNRFGRPIISWATDERSDSRVLFGTNTSLGQIVSDPFFDLDHTVSLDGLIPGRTYFFKVISTDTAGNSATNDNGGALYSFVAPAGRTVLLVDAFFNDLFFDPPLENYTRALDQTGVDYDVWDTSIEGSPTLADLRPYSTVIWRLAEISATTLSAAEQSAITNYLNSGGSLFIASMEVLSRLDEVGATAFRQNVLQVPAYDVDPGLPAVEGIDRDPITDGMSFTTDFSEYFVEVFGGDFSDTITPSTNAAGIFVNGSGDYAGLRYPRSGFSSNGRVVFLSFPFDVLPESGPSPNNRVELLRRILDFLAPGRGGVGVLSLDKSSYTIPSVVTVEVADSDLAGAGQVTVTASSPRAASPITVTLHEGRRGVFSGTFTLRLPSAPDPGLPVLDDDELTVNYFDASRGQGVVQTAHVDTQAPVISNVEHEPDYVEAFIYWETDEPTDALVQFGESVLLGRTAFTPELELSHEVRLLGLQPDRTYYYQVVSRDEAGNTVIDDNNGNFYTFRTLRPIMPPWTDNLDSGATNWTVLDTDETFSTWRLGVPNNGAETSAHSPPNAWGSNLDGGPLDAAETFLISPAIHLSGGNRATLRFWQSYDFTDRSELDIIELGQLSIITNTLSEPVPLMAFQGDATTWEEVEVDITPYVGHVVYFVWQYAILSFDSLPRPGWLIDDVSVSMQNVTPGTIVASNNLFQARFTITGPLSRVGLGASHVITNAPPGEYTISYSDVTSYQKPASQTQTLAAGGTVTFVGNYTFADTNANGMSDAWEIQNFGSVSSTRTAQTDTDADGITDAKEFIAGTNPNSTNSQFEATIPILLPDGKLRLQWPTVAGRGYRLEGSTNGVDWSPVTSWMISPGTLLLHDLPAWSPGAPFLFRIEVRP